MSSPSPHPLLDSWERHVALRPDTPAVFEPAAETTWSFGELERRSRRLAEQLGAQRLAGLPVAFCEANGGEWIARFLALLRLGAPALPLDSTTPAEGARATARRCGAAEWLADGTLALPVKARRYRQPAIALLKLTSGTTGEPKPLAFRAEELSADGHQVMRGMGIGAADRNFGIIPFGHSYGLGNLVMPLLLEGIPIVCGSSPLPHILVAEFARGEATVLPAVPALFAGLVRAQADLPGLRLAITAGAPLKPELAQGFLERFRQPLHNFLGSSESGGIAYDPKGDAGLWGRAVGRPLPGVEIAFDTRGRLAVASPAVYTRGNPLTDNGKGRVILGDAGEFNDRGELVLKGRTRPMIKVGARRLDPAEIERALLKIDEVREAWATGWNSGAEERPAAVVASTLSAAELRAILRLRLPSWKIPRPLVVAETFPLTQRGKADREAMTRLLKEAEAPRSPEEQPSPRSPP